MYKKALSFVYRKRWFVGITLILAAVAYYGLFGRSIAPEPLFAVVEEVGIGTVSSGIKTTGTIVAAQKLNLDVYKQSRRIEAVNVANAGRVEKGDVIVSFDKSSAYVAIQSARVEMAEAALALATKQANYTDANTTIRTLQNTLVTLHQDILEAEKSIDQARRTYLNADLSAEPQTSAAKSKTKPVVSGLYTDDSEGEYTIRVYASAAESGFSYYVTGLETGTESVIKGLPTPVGSRGLRIVFPDTIETGDTWTIAVANRAAPEYVVNKETYEKALTNLQTTIASKRVEIANTETQIKRESQTDTVSARDLEIQKARASLSASQQKVSENVEVAQEQNIVAPFSGTVEGMNNVVVGATPTGSTNDSISLGTLISDEFLVQFSLSAVDVAKVVVDQKVLVNVTSLQGVAPLEASITEVSSLPQSAGVAQYKVQALIELPASTTIRLREGLLADIEVVEEEVENVLRIPLSAVTYVNGVPHVSVLGALTPEQQQELDTMGIIRATGGIFPSYQVAVELGVVGSFFAEVTSGIEVGSKLVVTKTESEKEVVEDEFFGPPERSDEDMSDPE